MYRDPRGRGEPVTGRSTPSPFDPQGRMSPPVGWQRTTVVLRPDAVVGGFPGRAVETPGVRSTRQTGRPTPSYTAEICRQRRARNSPAYLCWSGERPRVMADRDGAVRRRAQCPHHQPRAPKGTDLGVHRAGIRTRSVPEAPGHREGSGHDRSDSVDADSGGTADVRPGVDSGGSPDRGTVQPLPGFEHVCEGGAMRDHGERRACSGLADRTTVLSVPPVPLG